MGGVFWFEMASTTTIEAAPQRVFEAVERANEWPRWSKVVASVEVAPAIPWQPGARLSFRLRMAGRVIPFRVQVTGYDRGRRVSWTSTKLTVTAVRTLSFEPEANGVVRTRVTDQKRFSSPILPVGLWYPKGVIRRMTEAWLRDLKMRVEAG